MSGWVALGLLVAGLVFIALIVLAGDVLRGDVGGRHTMARARRLLVVATDTPTEAGAERWIAEQHAERPDLQFFVVRESDGAERWISEQHAERPDLQFFVVSESDGAELWAAIQEAIAYEHPDAIVFARHDEHPHAVLDGVYGRLKEEHELPVDAIYVGGRGVV